MYEVWWADDGQERLRAKFRTLPDAIRFAVRADRAEDARLRHNGRWEAVSRYDLPQTSKPPQPSEDGRIGGVDPILIALDVMERSDVHEVDLVLRIVRQTLLVLQEQRIPKSSKRVKDRGLLLPSR